MLILPFLINLVKISTIPQQLNDMAALIANQEFSYKYPTAVVGWAMETENMINSFTKYYNGLIVTISLDNFTVNDVYFGRAFDYDQTVLYVKDVGEFESFLNMVNRVTVKSIHIIVVLVEINENITINEFTKIAWEKDAADIVIVSLNKSNEIALHTILPYSDGHCGDYTAVPIIKELSFFPIKFNNFHKCPVLVTAHNSIPYITVKKENNTISVKGFDGDVMKILLETLNATMILVSNDETKEESKFVKSTLRIGFRDLVNKVADVMIPAVVINRKRYSVALTSYTFNYVSIVWCAPRRREIYAWAKLILPFASRITPLIVLSFISFLAVIKLIKRLGRYREKSSGTTFQSLTLLLGLAAKFETKCWLNNTTYIMWIWYCFVVRIAYQGDLINGLHKVIMEPPIRTVNDALQTLDEVVGSPTIQELYRNTSIEKRFKALGRHDMEVYLKKLLDGERILKATDLMLIDANRYDVQILEESVIRLPACFFMRPQWPAASEFRRKIINLTEMGFLAHIYNQYLTDWFRRGPRSGNDVKSLNMLTLSSCFYGLLALQAICFVIFCFEILWFKLRNENKRRVVQN